ncbi:endonuclease V [Fervidobacterium thailandense]|uniref:Endonuclease V n=1 Tax=Fervidobacterium thailandense TaxID=1008305 RepID=A0A1E3G4D1_9BACT|nr:endonuclease V [Fervidobacterium thailandense]ODN30693.1 endonuclease V [Fervidobacterium thailandense]
MENVYLNDQAVQRFVEIQQRLSKRVVLQELLDEHVNLIGGMDVTYVNDFALGVLVVLDRSLNLVSVYCSEKKVTFPYVPGLLAFRELPVLLDCFFKAKKQGQVPDIVFLDGQGIAHPRRLGIASHFGILVNLPTIGVAKKRLYGVCKNEPLLGFPEPLLDRNGDVLGYCYIPKPRASPVYISPGHLCDPESALRVTTKMFRGYKLPEPTRLAHHYTQLLRLEKLRKQQ